VDLKDALFNTMKAKEQVKEAAADPLVQNGSKLIPSVTRVFSKDRQLYVYLQAYAPGATAAQPLVAFVSFYRGGAKVFETQPQAVTPGAATRLGTVALNFSIGLSELPPGEYDCQVNVIDPAGQKGTFWQAPIVVVP
jgi:hypothetical protein